jgi:hypothetical protein
MFCYTGLTFFRRREACEGEEHGLVLGEREVFFELVEHEQELGHRVRLHLDEMQYRVILMKQERQN